MNGTTLARFDTDTEAGENALLDAFVDETIAAWEIYERAFRDARDLGLARVDAGINQNGFVSRFVTFSDFGHKIVKPIAKARGPLSMLIFQRCEQGQALKHIFAALDEVRAIRDARAKAKKGPRAERVSDHATA